MDFLTSILNVARRRERRRTPPCRPLSRFPSPSSPVNSTDGRSSDPAANSNSLDVSYNIPRSSAKHGWYTITPAGDGGQHISESVEALHPFQAPSHSYEDLHFIAAQTKNRLLSLSRRPERQVRSLADGRPGTPRL